MEIFILLINPNKRLDAIEEHLRDARIVSKVLKTQKQIEVCPKEERFRQVMIHVDDFKLMGALPDRIKKHRFFKILVGDAITPPPEFDLFEWDDYLFKSISSLLLDSYLDTFYHLKPWQSPAMLANKNVYVQIQNIKNELTMVRKEDVFSIGHGKHFTHVCLADRSFLTRDPITQVAAMLPLIKFVVINEYILVNIEKIKRVEGSQLYLTNGFAYELQGRYKQYIISRLTNQYAQD